MKTWRNPVRLPHIEKSHPNPYFHQQIHSHTQTILRITDPDFIHPGYRISDPTTAKKEEGESFFSLPFFPHKYHKIINNIIFEQVNRFFLAITLRIIVPVFFTQKFVIKLDPKIWFWDQGYGKNLFRVPDPGSKRHRIPDLQHFA
jgi:hypothetical protein